jgi:hypothetical protein
LGGSRLALAVKMLQPSGRIAGLLARVRFEAIGQGITIVRIALHATEENEAGMHDWTL